MAISAPLPRDTCPERPTRMTMPNMAVAYIAARAMFDIVRGSAPPTNHMRAR